MRHSDEEKVEDFPILATISGFNEITDASNTYIRYNITVSSGSTILHVGRRYTEFHDLHEELKDSHPHIAEFPFPQKQFGSNFLNKSKTTLERKESFDKYLFLILSMRPVSPSIKEFLGLSRRDDSQLSSLSGLKVEYVHKKVETTNYILDSIPPAPSHDMNNRGLNIAWCIAATIVILFLSSQVVVRIINDVNYFMGLKPFLLKSPLQIIGLDKIFSSWLIDCAFEWFAPLDKLVSYFRSSLAVLVLITVSHRIVGYLFGLAVRYKLGTSLGAFQVDFEWIAIRLGFDRSEVVLHNIKWHNPPIFRETPYFCSIEEVVVRFDFLSCIGAIIFDKSYVAKIVSIEVDNVEVYIEKLHHTKKEIERNINIEHGKSSYNFNCALNNTSEDEKDDLGSKDSRVHHYISSIANKLESVIKYSVGSSKDTNITTNICTNSTNISKSTNNSVLFNTNSTLYNKSSNLGGNTDVTSHQHESFREVFHFNANKNIVVDSDSIKENNNYKNKNENNKNDKELIKVGKENKDSDKQTEESGLIKILNTDKTSRHSPSEKNVQNVFSPSKVSFFSHIHSSINTNMHTNEIQNKDFNDDKTTPESAGKDVFINRSDYDFSFSSPAENSHLNDNKKDNTSLKQKKNHSPDIKNSVNYIDMKLDATTPEIKKKKSPHMGIKYRFEINQLIVKDLRVHAEDVLYATHTETTESKTIKLNLFLMNHEQLNKHENIKEKEKEKEKRKRSFLHSNSNTSQKENSNVTEDADDGNDDDDDDDKNIDSNHKNDENVGSYADEILHRIINILQYEILSNNKLSLVSNIFGAAANHVTANLKEAATSAKRGVSDSVIAHNPKEFFYMANRVISKKVYSNKIENLTIIHDLGVSKLRVRLFNGRNFMQGNRLLDSSLLCSFRFLDESEGSLCTSGMESIKSSPKRPDSSHVTTWNETIMLSPIKSRQTVLHVRVFEYHLLKDIFVCELFFTLNGLFSNLERYQNAGIISEKDEKDGKNEISETKAITPNLDTSRQKDDGEKFNEKNIKDSKKHEMGHSVFSPIKLEGSVANVIFSVLPSIGHCHDGSTLERDEENKNACVTKSKETVLIINQGSTEGKKLKEIQNKVINEEYEKVEEKNDRKEKHLFSWQSLTSNRNEKIISSEIILNDLNVNENAVEVKKNINDAERNLERKNEKIFNRNDNDSCKISLEDQVTGGCFGEEIQRWCKCYGRQVDNENHIEKGEILLSFLLE